MRRLISFFLILISVASCTGYEKVVQSKDIEYKLAKANEYYAKGKYFEASRVYETLIPVLRGTKNYEELYYRFAYSFYYDKDYLNAAYQFKNFTEFFSKSNRVEEMYFMYAVSTYKDARNYNLDQTETEKAIAALQSFINMYGSSQYVEDAKLYLDSAYQKLEMKDAAAAKQYYDLDDYKAATVAYKTLIFDYPQSKQLDYYYYMLVKSFYDYARYSQEKAKEERYREASEYYKLLENQFPNSKYLADASKINVEVQSKLKELSK